MDGHLEQRGGHTTPRQLLSAAAAELWKESQRRPLTPGEVECGELVDEALARLDSAAPGPLAPVLGAG